MESSTAILLLTCPDAKGIVASISDFILKYNGNILCSAQNTVRHNINSVPHVIRFFRDQE
jgi:formyltetrahydrofolate hydrolase